MPGGNKNIKPEDGKPFKKNDPRINKKGRPRKLISNCIKEMDENGIKETSSEEIKSVYLRLINLTIPELEKKVQDEAEPVLTRIVGKNILSGKGFDILEKMFDRAMGRPQQFVDHKNNGGSFDNMDLKQVSTEDLERLLKENGK